MDADIDPGGSEDHLARECTQAGPAPGAGAGGWGGSGGFREKECYSCGGKGHFARFVESNIW